MRLGTEREIRLGKERENKSDWRLVEMWGREMGRYLGDMMEGH